MRKVLILQIKNHSNGGIRFVNKSLSDELTKLGYEVRICSIRDTDSSLVIDKNDAVRLDVINKTDKWEITHKKDVIKSVKNLRFFRTFKDYIKQKRTLEKDYLKLKDYIIDFNPNIIINSHYQILPGIPEEYLNRTINIYHTSYNMLDVYKDNKKKLYALKDKIHFVWLTKASCDKAIADGFTNSTFIYNPIKFKTSKKADVVNNKKLVCITRFGIEKRIPLMIDIADQVLKKNKDWSLELYGVDNEEEIKDKIKKTGNNRIKFMGSTNEVEKVLLGSSIYLCTSEFEGFSLSLLEAYECGIPVIAFDFGESCCEEVIDKKTGFIIEKDNINKYVEKLNEMINNTDLLNELSSNSKEFAKQFNIEVIIKRWIELFDKIEKGN